MARQQGFLSRTPANTPSAAARILQQGSTSAFRPRTDVLRRNPATVQALRDLFGLGPDVGDVSQADLQEAEEQTYQLGQRRKRDESVEALSQFFLPQAQERRTQEVGERMKLAGEPARVAGESRVAEEKVRQAGELEQQRVASAGLIGAAAERGAMGGVGGRLPAGTMDRIVGAQTSLRTLGRLKDLFRAEYVGPIEGRLNELRQKLPFVPVKPGFADFMANTSTLVNSIIKAITGAQMSEPEGRRIMRQIPMQRDKEVDWVAKTKASEENLNDIIGGNYSIATAPLTPGRAWQIMRELNPRAQFDVPPEDDIIEDPNWGRE